MDQRIVQFIAALRAQGVRVSLAESKDAFDAISEMGIQDREHFRVSLRSTLVKDADDLASFDELFPLFFQTEQPPAFSNPMQNLTPEQAKELANALRKFTQQLRQMMEKLMQGKPLSQEELRQLGDLVNLDDVSDMRFQEWKSRQMEQALQFREVQQALEELMDMMRQMGMDKDSMKQIREQVEGNQQSMQDQIRQYVGQRIMENMAQHTRQDKLDGLYNRPFNSLSDEEMHLLQKEVRRLAAILRTRLALRLKRAKGGQLDVKSTMRANVKYGYVPVEIKHRDHTLKPRIVILCDISTSMRHCSELMLSLLYAIQDQISKTHAFAYIDHLEYISPDLNSRQPTDAVSQVLQRMPSGHYNTDLGFSLENLNRDYLDTLDPHSTFIIVGDGRNNYNDPHLETFRGLTRRSRATIWLNPETSSLWGTGDSDMLKYAPYCSKAFQVSNLGQLATAIDHLLLNQ